MPMTLGNSDTLYIRIGKDKIIFARYDSVKDSTLNYSYIDINNNISVNANMRQALTKLQLAQGDFQRVHVSIDCKVTLIPVNEFDDASIEDLYNYNIPHTKRQTVFYDLLPLLNAIMLGAVDADLEHTILEAYPNATFHSTQMPLVLHFASLSQGVSDTGKLFVNMSGTQMTVSAFRKGQISFLNSFDDIRQVENAMYFILSMARQWDVKPTMDELYVVGNSEEAENLCERLKVYLPNSFLLKLEDEYNKKVLALSNDLPYDMIALLLKAY